MTVTGELSLAGITIPAPRTVNVLRYTIPCMVRYRISDTRNTERLYEYAVEFAASRATY